MLIFSLICNTVERNTKGQWACSDHDIHSVLVNQWTNVFLYFPILATYILYSWHFAFSVWTDVTSMKTCTLSVALCQVTNVVLVEIFIEGRPEQLLRQVGQDRCGSNKTRSTMKLLNMYNHSDRISLKSNPTSSYLWSTKTNFPSMACLETYSVGLTRMSARLGWGTMWGCRRPIATRQLRLQPSLSGSLSSSSPILVGGQLFR